MEIIERAKGKADGEIVSCFENENAVKDEVNLRTCKAGYTNRQGEPLKSCRISSGWNRKVESNYERIFGHE